MIRCPNCGTHMEDTETKCPICGEPVNPYNTINNNDFYSPGPESIIKNQFVDVSGTNSKFFNLPQSNNKYNQPNLNNPSPKNNHKLPIKLNSNLSIYLLIAGAIVIFAGIIFTVAYFSSNGSDKSIPEDENRIELKDIDDNIGTTDDNTGNNSNDSSNGKSSTDDGSDDNSDDVVNPTTDVTISQEVKIANYLIPIPDGYKISETTNTTVTIGNSLTGYIITIESGPYNLKKYRQHDADLRKSYEDQGATVERIYNDNIDSHDLHILEVDLDGTKFIIAITPSVTQKAYILTIFNGFQRDEYDYSALKETLAICDKITQVTT